MSIDQLKAGGFLWAFDLFFDLVDEDSFGVGLDGRGRSFVSDFLETLLFEYGFEVVVEGFVGEIVLYFEFPLVFEHFFIRGLCKLAELKQFIINDEDLAVFELFILQFVNKRFQKLFDFFKGVIHITEFYFHHVFICN